MKNMRKETDLNKVKERAKVLLQFEPRFIENSTFIIHPILKYDFVIDPDKTNGEVLSVRNADELEKIYEIYSSKIDKVTDYTDFILIIDNKLNYAFFFKETKEYVNIQDFSKFLGEMWTFLEAPNHNPNVTKRQLISYFKCAEKEYMMSQEELKLYDSLPNEIEVYRGVSNNNKKNGTKALSWTINKNIAKWFATRYDNEGIVFTAKAKKEDVLAYFNSREEEEVVIDYNNLEIISTEVVKK